MLLNDVDLKVVYSHEGSGYFMRPMKYSTACTVNLRQFPYDQQRCFFNYTSWVYESSILNITLPKRRIHMENYIMTGWEIVDTQIEASNEFFDCCNETYVYITSMVHMKRQPNFYTLTIVIPGTLISCLALVVFCLPPGCTDKLGFGGYIPSVCLHG